MDPNLACSTDDTIMVTHEGAQKKKIKLSLVNIEAFKNSGTRSMNCTDDDNEILKGMHAKITVLYRSSGASGQTCVTISGLDEHKLMMT